jgi:superoxide dismutase
MHFQLYKGYVKKTNGLMEKISEYFKDGKVDQADMPAYSELKRHLGFEYKGMVLHEYYSGFQMNKQIRRWRSLWSPGPWDTAGKLTIGSAACDKLLSLQE